MGVALTLDIARSRNAARLLAAAPAVAAAGALFSAVHLALGPTLMLEGSPTLRVALAAVLALLGTALAMRAGIALRSAPAPAAAALRVDAEGAPWLVAAPGAPLRPVALRASCVLPGLIVLVLAPYPDAAAASAPRRRPVTLLLGRDTLPDDAWRRLRRWLCWMERGRHDPPVSLPEDT